MSHKTPTTSSPRRRLRVLIISGCVILVGAVAIYVGATADRHWEQVWRDRVRVETPLGAGKAYVLLWADRNAEFRPHVGTVCEDKLKDIPILDLAGVDKSVVSSFARLTARRKDLFAGSQDNMRVYYFFDANDKVVGHFYLPFHELAKFEQAYQRLAAR